MRESYFCTDGGKVLAGMHHKQTVNIVFTGTSLENGCLYEDRTGPTMAVDLALKLTTPDYCLITDLQYLVQVFPVINFRPKTKFIIRSVVLDEAEQMVLYDYRTNESLKDVIEKTGPWLIHDTDLCQANQALTLAKKMGASEVKLYGLDLCSPKNRGYAHGIVSSPIETKIKVSKDLYTTDHWMKQKNEIEGMVSRWSDMKVVNMSNKSLLECFERYTVDKQ